MRRARLHNGAQIRFSKGNYLKNFILKKNNTNVYLYKIYYLITTVLKEAIMFTKSAYCLEITTLVKKKKDLHH